MDIMAEAMRRSGLTKHEVHGLQKMHSQIVRLVSETITQGQTGDVVVEGTYANTVISCALSSVAALFGDLLGQLPKETADDTCDLIMGVFWDTVNEHRHGYVVKGAE